MSTKSSKQAGNKAANAYDQAMAAGQEAVQGWFMNGTEGYEKAVDAMRVRAEEVAKGYDDFAVTGKANVDAVVAAGTAYTKGVEAMTAEWMNFAKQAVESNITASKAVFGAKTLQEMIDLQTAMMRTNFDEMMNQSTKVGELATKTAQETMEPLNARVAATVEKWGKAAA